ncbi:hypothetical protein, partial [Escherichia coli]|uniref:hypothetical protein n=1 Tax=Escherichia coli TaxID=562 RepID=UPI003DA27B63
MSGCAGSGDRHDGNGGADGERGGEERGDHGDGEALGGLKGGHDIHLLFRRFKPFDQPMPES